MATPGTTTFTTFTELVTTTFRNHRKELADNVTHHNALYRRLTEKGNVRLEDGGLSIVTPIDYGTNSTYQRYSGYDQLNIQASEVLSAAEWAWRQVAVNVTASGLELRNNSGENQIINLVKARVKNAQRSFANGLSGDFYSNGSLSNQINGLQAIIADTPTNTVGGISGSAFPFWQNIVQSAAAPLQGGGAITPSATTIESLMLPLYLAVTRGMDVPDLIVFSTDLFSFYEESQTSLKRYAPEDDGQGGMVKMKYKTSDVFFDSSASGIPSTHGYFINTDFFEVVVHRDANMEILPENKSVNQDAVVIPVLWQGNLVASNRFLQGVLKS